MDKIKDIKGIDPVAEKKLAELGIVTTEQFLAHTKTPAERRNLAKQIGVEPSLLTEWLNRADLVALKGVGREMANLLEEAGVDSLKELKHRKADNLYTHLKAINDEKKITHHAPSLAQVEAWINEAGTHPEP